MYRQVPSSKSVSFTGFGSEFDGISNGGDMEVGVAGVVWNKPGSDKDIAEYFGREPHNYIKREIKLKL